MFFIVYFQRMTLVLETEERNVIDVFKRNDSQFIKSCGANIFLNVISAVGKQNLKLTKIKS